MYQKWFGTALVFILTLKGTMVLAQQKIIDEFAAELAAVKLSSASARDTIEGKLDNKLTVLALLIESDSEDTRWLYELARVDKQVGSGSAASGSTSLISSGSVPFLLGLAVENGALTREESGTTVTFRANPANIARVIHSKDKTRKKGGLHWDDVSLALAFDTSRGDMAGSLSGSSEQLSQFLVRLDLVNDRDTRSTKWDDRWNEFAQGASASSESKPFHPAYSELADHLDSELAFQVCKTELFQAVLSKSSNSQKAEQEVKLALERFIGCARPSLRGERGTKVLELWRTYLQEKQAIANTILRSWTLAFEYVLDRAAKNEAMMVMAGAMEGVEGISLPPAMEPPDLSTFRLIFSKGFAWQGSELTLNGSVSIFNDKIEGVGRLRDYQFGAQFDIPLPEIPQIGKSTFSFSGLFASLEEMPFGVPLAINGQQVGMEGNMGLFQTKWSLPLGSSGARVPFSLTWSNRTELIDEDEVRASVGITFDLDKLFLKP